MKWSAAWMAAPSRVGATSVAAIDPEWSVTSISEACPTACR